MESLIPDQGGPLPPRPAQLEQEMSSRTQVRRKEGLQPGPWPGSSPALLPSLLVSIRLLEKRGLGTVVGWPFHNAG